MGQVRVDRRSCVVALELGALWAVGSFRDGAEDLDMNGAGPGSGVCGVVGKDTARQSWNQTVFADKVIVPNSMQQEIEVHCAMQAAQASWASLCLPASRRPLRC